MALIQTSEWQWEYQAKAAILGLQQSDLSGEVAFFDAEGGVYMLDSAGKLLLELGFSGAIKAARVVEEGKKLIVLDATGTLHAYDQKGKCLWQIHFDPTATCMDARAAGQGIVVSASNGLTCFYNGLGKKLRSVYLNHTVSFIKFAFDRGDVVAANEQGQISYLNFKLDSEWQMDVKTQSSGIVVNHDASLFLVSAYAEGVYAFNRNKETIGAYEIGGVVVSSALCQKGERILACNHDGRLHVIKRDGNLEYFFDIHEEIPHMDLNYEGDVVALQVGNKTIRSLKFIGEGAAKTAPMQLEVNVPETIPSLQTSLPENNQILWKRDFALSGSGLSSAQSKPKVLYTANGAYTVCLNEEPSLGTLDHDGKLLWQERLEPTGSYDLRVSHAGNLVLLKCKDYVDYFTGNQGRIERIKLVASHLAVHSGGLSFALVSADQKLYFFDKSGKCIWSKALNQTVTDLQVTPSGNAVFVATENGMLHALGPGGTARWEQEVSGLTPKSRLSLSKDGITIGNEVGNVFRIDAQGKRLWDRKIEAGLQDIEILRDAIFVRLGSGKRLALNRDGAVVAEREGAVGLTQMAMDNAGHLLFVKCEGDSLLCENCTDRKILWRHQAPHPIACFDIETSGGKLVYSSGGEIRSLALVAQPTPSHSVTFLEL